MAAALTEFGDTNPVSIEDATYGKIYFERTSWGYQIDSPTRLYPRTTNLFYHECT